ncbi:MAG: acyl-CoA dehydrogenase family protein [Halioglobus sp.]
MTPQQLLLQETVDNVFGELVAKLNSRQQPLDFDSAWLTLQDLGIDNLFVAEEEGGFSGSWQDARIVFYLAGRHGLALPICETIVAKKILLDLQLPIPEGPLTFGLSTPEASLSNDKATGGKIFSGNLLAVPWGRNTNAVVTFCHGATTDSVVLLQCSGAQVSGGRVNDAGEPRDNMQFHDASVLGVAALPNASEKLLRMGALMRASQMSGALDSALQLSIEHVSNREQFGRPLAKFQAIQQQLAIFAEEAAAVNCASQAACDAEDHGDSLFEVAATKLRSNRAVGITTSIAHQVHGAIGLTKEYDLHLYTQRLWSWRSEFGNDRYWSKNLGQQVLAVKDEGFWNYMTARSDRISKL